MAEAQEGDRVKVHYTGKLNDGTEFDSSVGREPIEFQLGQGEVIPGFESAVVGMAPGEKKEVRVESDQAYGPHIDELVQEVPREQIPGDIDIELGMKLKANVPGGEQPLVLTVVGINDGAVKLDANHPLAGEDLNFELTLVEIV